MTTGNVSSGADIKATLLNMAAQSNTFSFAVNTENSFQSFMNISASTTSTDLTSNIRPADAVNSIKSQDTRQTSDYGNKTRDIIKNTSQSENMTDDVRNNIVSDTVEQIKDVIKDTLKITDEELENMMAELGITPDKLLIPQNLVNIVAMSMDTDAAAIVTDDVMSGQLKSLINSITDIVEQSAQKADISVDQLVEMINQQTQTVVPNEESDNTAMTSAPQMDVGDSNTDSGEEYADSEAQVKATVVLDAETGKTVEITLKNNEITSETTQYTGTAVQTEKDGQQGSNNNSFEHESKEESGMAFAQNLVQNLTGAVTDNLAAAQSFGEMYQVNASDIINQMMDAVKVNFTPDTTSMEIQLTPENLGKVSLNVASRDGVVTASIVAQNEAVKNVIESQVAQLKENLNNQGIKVADIEVTVASQGFDANADNSSSQNNEERGFTGRRFRGADELPAEEDMAAQLEQKIMEADGNSVNLTA